MIEIDGATGEGGGQILRSCLTLSLITKKPFRMINVRANRKKTGLLRQHLTAVQAAKKISDADVVGDTLGSAEITFTPGLTKSGEYHFSVGTAGSTTLILQTILLPLCITKGTTKVVLEGGTHNPMAPPFEFLQKAYLPILKRIGIHCELQLESYGFYPAGGGKIVANLSQALITDSVNLVDRGQLLKKTCCAIIAGLPKHIADRELAVIKRATSWPDESLRTEEVKRTNGPGNIVLVELEFENVHEVFTGFGERGKPAEGVAGHAVDSALDYLKHSAAVGTYLADQLLLPVALAGRGSFTSLPLSRHSTTNIEIIKKFLPVEVNITKRADRTCLVEINS